ncbi:MAG: DNA mismatch endonuclease Vsr [Anaerolineae bacterium]|nr:DNA mismatch endonuclease Vsr [Anaerolineae bacterium]
MDKLSKQRRSRNMARIRSANTAPELAVRRELRSMRVGYRIHDKRLPGRPDIVMWGRKKAIFVHGCFWHQHEGCIDGRRPQTRREYWDTKLDRNVARDEQHLRQLAEMGWDVLVVWDCQTRDEPKLKRTLAQYLDLEGKRAISRP